MSRAVFMVTEIINGTSKAVGSAMPRQCNAATAAAAPGQEGAAEARPTAAAALGQTGAAAARQTEAAAPGQMGAAVYRQTEAAAPGQMGAAEARQVAGAAAAPGTERGASLRQGASSAPSAEPVEAVPETCARGVAARKEGVAAGVGAGFDQATLAIVPAVGA